MSEARSRTTDDSSSAEGGEEGEANAGEAFTATASASGGRTNDANPLPEKRLCVGTKKDGNPCRAYALGKAYGDASHLCAGHAKLGGRHASRKALGHEGDRGKGLKEAAAPAARGKRTPMDLLRAKMEADPETVAELAWKAMQEGRDVRAITAMLDRTFGEESAHVAEPHTFDELAKLSREQRRALITQLEREGRGSPFRMPEH
jgi:hypothetical protein